MKQPIHKKIIAKAKATTENSNEALAKLMQSAVPNWKVYRGLDGDMSVGTINPYELARTIGENKLMVFDVPYSDALALKKMGIKCRVSSQADFHELAFDNSKKREQFVHLLWDHAVENKLQDVGKVCTDLDNLKLMVQDACHGTRTDKYNTTGSHLLKVFAVHHEEKQATAKTRAAVQR